MEKRQADGAADGNASVSKRGRWDSGPGDGAAPAAAAAPLPPAAAAAALAAAVAAKYTQAPAARPAGLAIAAPGTPGVTLPSGAAAAVAQAAAAALQKLPLAAAAALQPPGGAAGPCAAPAPAGAAAGARPPSISLDALEKAKKALQLQKEIQEKLKSRLPQLASKLPAPAAAAPGGLAAANGGAAVGAGAAAVPAGVVPSVSPAVRPLLAVPGSATPSLRPPLPTSGVYSLLPRPPLPPPLLAPPLVAPEPEPEPDSRFYDPVLAAKSGAAARKGDRRRRAGFDFVNEGKFQREAELFRLKSQLGAGAFRRGAPRVNGPLGEPHVRLPLALGDANLVPLGVREKVPEKEATPAPEAEPVPAVEWWDKGLLAHSSLDQDVPALPAQVREAVEALAAAAAASPRGPGRGPSGGDGDGDTEMGEGGEEDGPASGGGMDGEEDEGSPEGREVRQAKRREVQGALAAAVEAAAQAAAGGGLGSFQLREARITLYVEHPVPMEPPAEAPPPPPQPLKLTARELKKLRTQRRIARDKEKQELIRQGLLEPPKPKVRIANLHRVLGTDASLDPTAVEKEVRKQMAERQAAHDDRNLARMLTPAERRDKKLRKLFGSAAVESGAADVGARGGARGSAAAAAAAAGAAAGVDVICSVFRVGRLTDPAHRFKVDANARENHMTGISVISDDFSVVVVEGVEKATRRYTKLMMRRIDWSTAPAVAPGGVAAGGGGGRPGGLRDANGDAAMGDGDEDEEEGDRPPNICTLVWQGTVLRRAFNGFRSETVRSAAAGRQMLADTGVGHYWDAAAAATEGESVPFTV